MKPWYQPFRRMALMIRTLLTPSFYAYLAHSTLDGYRHYQFHQNLKLRYPLVILPNDLRIPTPERVNIGIKSIISPGCYFNCGFAPYWGTVKLGQQVIIGYNSCLYAGGGQITIGDHVDMGINCVVSTQTRSMAQNPMQEPLNFEHRFGEVHIGDGTLIASNVTILADTTLGKYCNVVAGSVVQGHYPDHTTLAGNPARPIPRIPFPTS